MRKVLCSAKQATELLVHLRLQKNGIEKRRSQSTFEKKGKTGIEREWKVVEASFLFLEIYTWSS